MNYLLSQQELDDLRAKTRTPEQIEAERRMLANATLDLIESCTRALKSSFAWPQMSGKEIEKLNKAAEDFCRQTGISFDFYLNIAKEREKARANATK